MGDPAGIGPEVIVRAWADPQVHEHVRPLVIGHPDVLHRAAKLVGTEIKLIPIDSPDQWSPSIAGPRAIPIIKACGDETVAAPTGMVDARSGEAAYQCVTAAVRWALAQKDRCDRNGAAQQGGIARGRASLSGAHRIAGRDVRRERFCNDAVSAGRQPVCHCSRRRWERST